VRWWTDPCRCTCCFSVDIVQSSRENISKIGVCVDDCEKREVAVQMMLESAKRRNEIQVTERESQEAINDCGTVGR
jgi:hypothetical protein